MKILPILPFLIACSSNHSNKDSATNPTEDINPLNWDVNLSGPFRTGYISVEETYTDLTGEERIITVNIWYPTNDEDGDVGVYVGYLEDLDVFSDAAIADPVYETGFPLFLFSHGNFGYGGNSPFLMHHLTSHGFVVIAPDHKGNSVLDYGEDQVPMIKIWRMQDDQAAITALDQLDWGNKVYSQEVILSGHSFGSWDSWLLGGGVLDQNALDIFCESDVEFSRPCTEIEREAFRTDFKDERIKGILPMAGAQYFEWFEENGRRNLSTSVYQMSGTDDDDEPQRVFEENESTPLRWLEIQGGCHQAFALGACPNISNDDAFRITKAYNLAFAREILFQDASVTPKLNGETTEDKIMIYK
jgi:predicted dienelactone hydrolase